MLSSNAQKLITEYLSLPFSDINGIRCPYFVNTRAGKRGALRPLIGKGTPQEIVEEAKIVSLQYHCGIFDHDGCCFVHQDEPADENLKIKKIRQFLIDNNLGIDCSGLVTNVLRAHFEETAGVDIARMFVKNIPAGILRKIIMRLRPVESIGVKSGYANDLNTEKLGDETTGYDYTKIAAGDVVVMLGVDSKGTRNHILLITDCDGQTIKYIHSRAWNSEGQYGHGVNTGEIKIIAPGKGLLAQQWIEKSPALPADLFHQSNTNETFAEAKNARVLEIRRVRLSS